MTEALVAHFVASTPEMVDDLAGLVARESPSGDPDALRGSAEAVDALGSRLLGQSAERVVVAGITHLRWRFGGDHAQVMLLGHHDTVWPVGTLERLPVVVSGDPCRRRAL